MTRVQDSVFSGLLFKGSESQGLTESPKRDPKEGPKHLLHVLNPSHTAAFPRLVKTNRADIHIQKGSKMTKILTNHNFTYLIRTHCFH